MKFSQQQAKIMLWALQQVEWKLQRNDTNGPAKIDRNDAVMFQVRSAIADAAPSSPLSIHEVAKR